MVGDVRRTSRSGAGRNQKRDALLAKELVETQAALLKKKKAQFNRAQKKKQSPEKKGKIKAPKPIAKLPPAERRAKVLRQLGLTRPEGSPYAWHPKFEGSWDQSVLY